MISEPLSQVAHELHDGLDYLQASTPEELLALADRLASQPDAFADVQAAGRLQAERFRASLVYPPLLREAVAEVAAEAAPGQGGRVALGSAELEYG